MFSECGWTKKNILIAVAGSATDGTSGVREAADQTIRREKGLYANLGWEASDNIATRSYATFVDVDAELPRELTPQQFEEDPSHR